MSAIPEGLVNGLLSKEPGRALETKGFLLFRRILRRTFNEVNEALFGLLKDFTILLAEHVFGRCAKLARVACTVAEGFLLHYSVYDA